MHSRWSCLGHYLQFLSFTCAVFFFFFLTDGSVNEDVIITKPFGNDKMTCREIRRNSAGCVKLREECEKCKEIQHIGKLIVRGTL